MDTAPLTTPTQERYYHRTYGLWHHRLSGLGWTRDAVDREADRRARRAVALAQRYGYPTGY